MARIKVLDRDLPVKLEWLKSFLAVTECGGFTKAARQLRMSQPAVSTHVIELEKNLRTTLFEKFGNHIRLTRTGEALVADARAVIQGVQQLQVTAAESETGIGGSLSVGASTTPGNYVLPRLLGEFERRFPSVRTTLQIGNSARILDRLQANGADLGAVGILPPAETFTAFPLCHDEIVVFAPRKHPLARHRGPLSVSDFSKHRIIVRESDSATRRLTEGWLTSQKVAPKIMELGCPETIKQAVAAGLGVGVLSRFAISAEAGARGFVALSIPGFPIRRPLYLVHLRQKHLTRTMNAFLGLIKTSKSLPRLSR